RRTCGFTQHRSLTSPMVKYRFAGMGGRLTEVSFVLMDGSGTTYRCRAESGIRHRRAFLFNRALQFLTRMERYHAPRRNGNDFPGLGVSAGTWRLVTHLEIAKPGQFHFRSAGQSFTDLLKEGVYDILGLALVQADPFEQQFSEFGLGECTLYGHR